MTKKIKILFLIHLPPPVHGVSTICKQVIETEFINSSVEKTIIKLNLSYSINDLRKFSIIKIFRLISIIIKLVYRLITFKPNFVYFSIMPIGKGFLKDSILVFFIKLFSVKIIFHIHNKGIPGYYKKSFYRWTHNKVFKNSNVIHLSDSLKKTELGIINTHGLKTYVIPNGIKRINKKELKHTKKNIINVLFLANLIPDKGYLTCLNAFEILISKGYKQVRMIIAGSPTHAFNKMLSEFLKNNTNLKDFITLRGPTFGKQKEEIYNLSDIFIFPSRFTQECMPLVILEAMSVGMPVIASNIGAIPEMVKNNINGFLIPPGNQNMLAEKIEYFLTHYDKIELFGKESLSIYNSRYTLKHFEANLNHVISEIIHKKN